MNEPLTYQEIAALAQEDKHRRQIEMMRRIWNPSGFISYYLEQLPNHNTAVECFNCINDLHTELFGEEKYSSYVSFQNQLRKYAQHEK